jgi:DNA-binding NarL/FixJ family response regulator
MRHATRTGPAGLRRGAGCRLSLGRTADPCSHKAYTKTDRPTIFQVLCGPCPRVRRKTQDLHAEGHKAIQVRRKSEFQGTVLIADDHEIFRLGLLQLLRRSLKVKRFLHAASFAQVIEHLRDEDVSLVILDLKMPGLTASTEIRRLRLLRPDARMVVVSGSECREDILGCLSAGVHGYIVKNQQTDQLIRRLRYILSGEMYVPASLAELLPETTEASTSKPIAQLLKIDLSKRQRQVLKGLIEGKSNKEIAQALGIAEGTVKIHLAALFRLLRAANRAHAVALGKQLIG